MIKKKYIKIPLSLVLFIMILLSGAFLGIKIYVNSFIEDNYNNRVNLWNETNKNIPSSSIVFLGDSITEYFMLNEFFPNKNVINRGIYGDTSKGALTRLDESIYSLNPSKVFLLIGTNDLDKTNDTPDIIGERIKNIVYKIKEKCPNTIIYIQSIYPVNKNMKSLDIGKRNNKDISSINTKLFNIANNKDIFYIDVYSQLIDKNGDLNIEYTLEGLHLSPKGYRKVHSILNKYI